MNKRIAAVMVAVAVSLALCSCSATADAPLPVATHHQTTDQQFNAYLNLNAPDLHGTEQESRAVAKAFCRLAKLEGFDNAVTWESQNFATHPNVSSADVAAVIIGAVQIYCPQFSDDLAAYTGN